MTPKQLKEIKVPVTSALMLGERSLKENDPNLEENTPRSGRIKWEGLRWMSISMMGL